LRRYNRGRIWMLYRLPDEIDTFPNGSASRKFTKPTQIWRYRHIQEYAPPKQVIVQGKTELKAQTIKRANVIMKFVDACRCGDYHLQPTKERN
jgi:hypothetical protein